MIRDIIRDAIRNKRIIEFDYDGYHRIAEPHVHGISNGEYELHTYQIGGGSKTGGIPDWRRMKVAGIKNLLVLERVFKGRRLIHSRKHSPFDKIFDIVDP